MCDRAITSWSSAGGLRRTIASGLLGFALSGTLHGAESTPRQHGAHAHGEGVLEVAVDGHDLLVSFRIPAVNVVGFEHAPADDAQRRTIAQARERFRDGAGLLVPSAAAGCRLVDAEVTLGARAHGGARRARTESGGHGHDGTTAHAKARADDHGHGHDDAHGHAEPARSAAAPDSGTHSELHAEYVFRCEQPEALTAIDVRLLDALLDVHAVEAHVVTPSVQHAAELRPGQTSLRLTR